MAPSVSNAWPQHRDKDLSPFSGAWLKHFSFSDAGPEHPNGVPQLQLLKLTGTKVSGAGLEHLEELTQLQWLYLDRTKLSDAGLEHLEGLTQLEFLDLSGTKVSDAGLEHLKGLTHLQWLYLEGTNVSDAGLEHLRDRPDSAGWTSVAPTSATPGCNASKDWPNSKT